MSAVSSLPDRVDDVRRAPVAAVMFALADHDRLGVEQLADPATATVLATLALAQLGPWAGDGSRASTLTQAFDVVASRRVRQLLADVLHDERNAWWDAPLDPERQLLLLGREDRREDLAKIPVPSGPISSWETYAQKPSRTVITTTELRVGPAEDIRSGGHADLANGRGDWNPVYPVEQYRCRVAAQARVFEVNSAADWHALVAGYGDAATHAGSDAQLRSASGIDNGLAPTWSSVAADYDGVHLSFVGMLTALQNPVSSGAIGTTTLWAWDFECTHWIHSVFGAIEKLSALVEQPEPARFW